MRSWLVVAASLVFLAGVLAAIRATDNSPVNKPVATRHVVFTATPNPPIGREPPCYRMAGVNAAAGAADPGATWEWEMLGSATQAQIAAVRVCLSRAPGLGPIRARIVTAPPSGRV